MVTVTVFKKFEYLTVFKNLNSNCSEFLNKKISNFKNNGKSFLQKDLKSRNGTRKVTVKSLQHVEKTSNYVILKITPIKIPNDEITLLRAVRSTRNAGWNEIKVWKQKERKKKKIMNFVSHTLIHSINDDDHMFFFLIWLILENWSFN